MIFDDEMETIVVDAKSLDNFLATCQRLVLRELKHFVDAEARNKHEMFKGWARPGNGGGDFIEGPSEDQGFTIDMCPEIFGKGYAKLLWELSNFSASISAIQRRFELMTKENPDCDKKLLEVWKNEPLKFPFLLSTSLVPYWDSKELPSDKIGYKP